MRDALPPRLALCGPLALAASCAIDVSEPCPGGPQPALAITPLGPGGRICNATVTASEVNGAYTEVLQAGDDCIFRGATDRPDAYKVVVEAPGFATTTIWPDASDTLCDRARTFAVTVTMTPSLTL